MSSRNVDASITIGVDLGLVEQELAKGDQMIGRFNKRLASTLNRATGALRQATQLTFLFAASVGGVVDQTLIGVAESLLLAFEAITGIAAAESLTVVGVLGASIKFAAAASLLIQIRNVNRGRTEIAQRQSATTNFLRGISYVI